MKLMLHELDAARSARPRGPARAALQDPRPRRADPAHAVRAVERAGDADAQRSTWSSATSSAPASGFQSLQYRAIEFLLGNKDAQALARSPAYARRCTPGSSAPAARPRASTTSSCATSRAAGCPSRRSGSSVTSREPYEAPRRACWPCSGPSTSTRSAYWDGYEMARSWWTSRSASSSGASAT